MKITLVTTNPHKKKEWQSLFQDFNVRFVLAEEAVAAPEENVSFAENARAKVLFYKSKISGALLAEDSGFMIEGLGGFPGVYSSRVLSSLSDREKNQKFLDFLACYPYASRRCCYRLAVSFLWRGELPPEAEKKFVFELTDGGVLFSFQTEVWGEVARSPSGENGFGYDPIFYLPEYGKPFAELSLAEKNSLSHRGQAARKLKELLQCLISSSPT